MQLLEALNKVTQDDLDKIRSQIADLENQIGGLRTIEKIMNAKLHPRKWTKKKKDVAEETEPPAEPPPADDSDDDGDDDDEADTGAPEMTPERRAILKFLQHVTATSATIQRSLDLTSTQTTIALNCPWFTMGSGGQFRLTPAGKDAAERA